MKIKILAIVLTLLLGAALTSCGGSAGEPGEGDFVMRAEIRELGSELLVDVIEAPHGNTGLFYIVTSAAQIYDSTGKINASDLAVGDIVEISYGGQVMMSYPPKVSAVKISVVERAK